MSKRWIASAVAMIAIAVIALFIGKADAHDHSRPFLDGWYSGLKSGKGPCCGGPTIDAKTLDGPDWERTSDGHYRVRIEGQWWDVPDEAVLSEPNKDGRTLVWPVYRRALGALLSIEIRCFMPGVMT